MTTYIWAWANRDGVSVNESETLESIIQIIFENFQYDHRLLHLVRGDGKFKISVDSDGVITAHEMDDHPDSVREFLEKIASINYESGHKFYIVEKQNICRI